MLDEFSMLGDLKIKKNAPITMSGEIEYPLNSLCPCHGILLHVTCHLKNKKAMHRMTHIGKSFHPLPPECCYSYPTTSNSHKQYQHNAFPIRDPKQQLTLTNVVKTNHQHPSHKQ